MKFSAPVLALSVLVPSAFGRVVGNDPRGLVVDQRDLATFESVLGDVDTDINKLDTAVKAYTGGAGTNVINAANELTGTINSGKTTIDGQPQLTLSEALALQDPVETLTASTKTLVDDLTGKRSSIISNKLCATTRGLVGKIDTSANALINSVVSKVPSAAQSIAERLVRDLRSELARAKTNFNAENCPA